MIAFNAADEQYIAELRENLQFPHYPMETTVKATVLHSVHASLRKQSGQKARVPKWKRVAAIVPLVGLPLGAVTAFEWNNVHVSTGGHVNYTETAKQGVLGMFSPRYYDDIVHVPGLKSISLSEARAMNRFPIREPMSVKDWTRVHSTGTIYGGVLMYYDFYQNSDGALFNVQQNYDIGFTGAQQHLPDYQNLHFSFLRGSTLAQGFGGDLAAYTDMQQGRSNLAVIHKEENGTFTDFTIYGYRVSQSELEQIAHDYLQAPTK